MRKYFHDFIPLFIKWKYSPNGYQGGNFIMATYNVTITNGTGSQRMQIGTYDVTAEAAGYDVSTLTPKTFTATDAPQTQAFTLTANGTLTLIVNDTGAAGGTPITSGSIVMTDETGTTEYGQPVEIGADGTAVFNNVPYGTTTEPFTLYFKQLTTADDYNIFDGVITVAMAAQTQTEYIQNTQAAENTFTLTDDTYGMPVDSTLTFTENA